LKNQAQVISGWPNAHFDHGDGVIRLRNCSLIAVTLLSLNGGLRAAISQSALTGDDYSTRIQPIFTSRCIACHSCYNAPCQLNLQSYSGVARGAAKLNVYDRSRLESVAPSRLGIDGHSVSDWRARGFFDVMGKTTPARTLLMQFLELRAGHPAVQPRKSVEDSNFCPANGDQFALSAESTPELGMPYGLPPLSQAEIATMRAWISNDAPGPTEAKLASRHTVPPEREAEVRTWETFLNGSSPREKLFARYLLEHLFLAHLHFLSDATSPQPVFFRLVRSRTPCESGIDEIATRRPNDDPGSPDFHYCLSQLDTVIVDKTHIPYELSPQKLDRIRSLFLEPKWDVEKLPGYDEDTAANPFATFADIPVRSRYQFLLDDAEYEVNTFIKGPVCNGSIAVNSIQAQFLVLFLRPDADSMVTSPEFARRAQDLLILPGVWGSDVPLVEDVAFYERLISANSEPKIFAGCVQPATHSTIYGTATEIIRMHCLPFFDTSTPLS
jgi:Fatty acid cis/trans isomerase (CTI)